MNYLKFADNLKHILSYNNISQQTLADVLGTTQATVSRWIQGVHEPDLATILDICLYLNETPSSLLGFDDIPQNVVNEYYQKTLDFKKDNKHH